jgi:conjugal transfer pilin signal peptidase TrbI
MNNKRSTFQFILRALPVTIVFVAGALYLTDRYSVGIDPQKTTCLPWRVFVVDKHDQFIVRGEIYAFKSQSMEPFFKNGTQIIKVADGVPGDKVKVTLDKVTVNGLTVGEGVVLSEKTGKPASRFIRD